MIAIEDGGLLIIPRVTDMRNGLFRPEVCWSKGRASDIIFGECFSMRLRAQICASQAARLVLMTQKGADELWRETSRSIGDCKRLVDLLQASIL